jgi:hypothetical protein
MSPGYGGRIALRNDVFNGGAFKLQIVGLTLAPAFLAAGLYLNLKHMIMVFGSGISLLKPHLYTWVFVGCDILSIAMQGVYLPSPPPSPHPPSCPSNKNVLSH